MVISTYDVMSVCTVVKLVIFLTLLIKKNKAL